MCEWEYGWEIWMNRHKCIFIYLKHQYIPITAANHLYSCCAVLQTEPPIRGTLCIGGASRWFFRSSHGISGPWMLVWDWHDFVFHYSLYRVLRPAVMPPCLVALTLISVAKAVLECDRSHVNVLLALRRSSATAECCGARL